MIRSIVAASLLLLTAGAADAQWRTIRSVDDATGQPTVMALAEGSYGHLRVLVDCQRGFHILGIGFTGNAVFANGAVRLVWNDGPEAEQHYWEPDDDYEVLYVTTWTEERGGRARYDPTGLAFFENLRRHTHFWVQVTPRTGTAVTEHFGLTGAAQALQALTCSRR